MNFGALRVINDDYIKGPSGFGKHPHRDAEIFTYIVEGQLSHEDSMRNKEALPRGCVQYLSAGTGITHSVSCLCNALLNGALLISFAICLLLSCWINA